MMIAYTSVQAGQLTKTEEFMGNLATHNAVGQSAEMARVGTDPELDADTGIADTASAARTDFPPLADGDWITYTDNGDGEVSAGDRFTEKSGDEMFKFRLDATGKHGLFNVMYVTDDGKAEFQKQATTTQVQTMIDAYVKKPVVDESEAPAASEEAVEPEALYTCDDTGRVKGSSIWEDNGDGKLGVGDYVTMQSTRFYLDQGKSSDLVDAYIVFANGATDLDVEGMPLRDIAEALVSEDCAN